MGEAIEGQINVFWWGGGDYCSPLWGACNKTFKDKLQKFQNRAAEIIAGVSLDTRFADVLRSLSWNELEVRRHISESPLIYKILNDYTGPNLKESLIRRNIWQTNYDLRNSQADLPAPKPKREFLNKVSIIGGKTVEQSSTECQISKFCPLTYKYNTGHTRLMYYSNRQIFCK